MLFVGKGTLICLLTVIFSEHQLRRKSESLCNCHQALSSRAFAAQMTGFVSEETRYANGKVRSIAEETWEFVQNMSCFSRKFRESLRERLVVLRRGCLMSL